MPSSDRGLSDVFSFFEVTGRAFQPGGRNLMIKAEAEHEKGNDQQHLA